MKRAFLLLVLSLGCDVGVDSGGPSSICTESGAQCVLPSGPLGVCERVRCSEQESKPCFQCTPQH